MTPSLDDPAQARHGGADWLSLALIDARNHTLRWLAAFEALPAPSALAALQQAGLPPPRWLAGHAAWWQEWWIVRNVESARGEACDIARPRLASIDPGADALFDPTRHGVAARWQLTLPASEALRQYLAGTLEAALDALSGVADDDAALYFHRLALWREDRLAERFAEAAQALDEPLPGAPRVALPARAAREPLWWPACRTLLGAAPGGLVPPGERWAHEVVVPEFEIDAQAVSWARFVEFAADGGYDDRRCWTDAGWAWAQAQGRRAPRYVERLLPDVVLQRQGRLQRAPLHQGAVHLTRHEAEAWCRWAGRRLPTEVEWELAAARGASRGFVWGDVLEWTAGRARPWPGCGPAPGMPQDSRPDDAAAPSATSRGVLRGAAGVGAARQRHTTARRFVALQTDLAFCGFRSCAL